MTPFELNEDGVRVSVEVRVTDECTTAALNVGDENRLILATVATGSYQASQEVQEAFQGLVKSIVKSLIQQALPEATVGETTLTVPADPFGGMTH